ncbi:MAG: DUF2505 domain-containing protein [Nocardioides sp.]|nr:DUF2505 domain-containing protein [Nocardioides sp.]
MKFRQEMQYDAPPAAVRAMVADPAFREEVCEEQGTLRHDVTITPDGEQLTVRIELVQPTTGVPAVAKKFVGNETEVVQEESWHDATSADLKVTIPGKPGSLVGGIRLEEDGDGTRQVIEGDLKVSVPLVAGKLEKVIADLLSSAIRAEERAGKRWLARG